MSDIDPYQFGRMVQAVETMSDQVAALRREVDELKGALSGGKGVALGLMIAAGGLGAGLSKLLDHLVK